jgi:hypothetical protein
MPKWLKIALGVVAAAAVVIGLFVYMVMWATSGIVEPVERQLAALKAGNMDAAYAETSEAFKGATSIQQFTAFVDQYPALKDAADYSFSSRSITNNEGYLKGELVSSTGGVTPIEYRLVHENDVWKIQYINVTPPGVSG